MKYLILAAALFFVTLPCIAADEPTWMEIDNVVYGAKPDSRGPIGGGNGYADIITEGDFIVSISGLKCYEAIFLTTNF